MTIELNPVKKSDNFYIYLFLSKLGIDVDSYTDPELLVDILKEDMKLNDMPEIKEIFGNKLIEKKSLKNFLEQIIEGVITKHPAVLEFLIAIIEKKIIDDIDESTKKTINRVIHYSYLLEEITLKMYDDIDFNEKIVKYLIEKRKAFYLADNYLGAIFGIYKITGKLFTAVKTMSVDRTIKKFIYLRKNNKICYSELIKLRLLFILNILEASITDLFAGFIKNAFCGFALLFKPVEKYTVAGENKALNIYFPKEWCSLYETWNFAFVSGNFINLNIIYPKLLIPSIINGESPNYIVYRGYALWLSLNFGLFARSAKKVLIMKNSKEIAKIWGSINLKYGCEFIKKCFKFFE